MFKRFSKKKSRQNCESNNANKTDNATDEQFINDMVTDIQNDVKSMTYENVSIKNDDTTIEYQKVTLIEQKTDVSTTVHSVTQNDFSICNNNNNNSNNNNNNNENKDETKQNDNANCDEQNAGTMDLEYRYYDSPHERPQKITKYQLRDGNYMLKVEDVKAKVEDSGRRGRTRVSWKLSKTNSKTPIGPWWTKSQLLIYPKKHKYLGTSICIRARNGEIQGSFASTDINFEFIGENIVENESNHHHHSVLFGLIYLKISVNYISDTTEIGDTNEIENMTLTASIANSIINNSLFSNDPNNRPESYDVNIRGGFYGGELSPDNITPINGQINTTPLPNSNALISITGGPPKCVSTNFVKNIYKILSLIEQVCPETNNTVERLDKLIGHILQKLENPNYKLKDKWNKIDTLLDETERNDDDIIYFICKLQARKLNHQIIYRKTRPINGEIINVKGDITLKITGFNENTDQYYFYTAITVKHKEPQGIGYLYSRYQVYGFKYYNAIFHVNQQNGMFTGVELLDKKDISIESSQPTTNKYQIEYVLYKLRKNTEFTGLNAKCESLKVKRDFKPKYHT